MMRYLYVDEGLSCHEIGVRLATDPQRVKYWLKKHGIPLRPPAHRPFG